MSDVSESFYLRSDKQQEGIDLLKRAGLTGIVFAPVKHWVTLIPQVSLREALEPLVAANEGALLHYIFAEDYGWGFRVYDKSTRVSYYECSWESDIVIHEEHVQRELLEELFKCPLQPSQLESLLHPVMLGDLLGIDHRFADLFELEYYEWLSAEHFERMKRSYQDQIEIVEERSPIQPPSTSPLPFCEWRKLENTAQELLYDRKNPAEALRVAGQALVMAEQAMANEVFCSIKWKCFWSKGSLNVRSCVQASLWPPLRTLLRCALHGFNMILKLAARYEEREERREAERLYSKAVEFSGPPFLVKEHSVQRRIKHLKKDVSFG